MKTWRLVSGIISIVLSSFVLFQSCAAGFVNSVESNGQVSGTAGVLVALLMISGGILSISTRKEISKGGSIALMVIFGLAALIGFVLAGNFEDLLIWSFWCFICAALALISYVFIRMDEKDAQKAAQSALHKQVEQAERTPTPKKKPLILTILKWVLIVLGGIFILIVIVALMTGGSEEDAQPDGPADLSGTWRQVNTDSTDTYQAARITDNVIEVYWIDRTSETQSLYWAGTFDPPTTSDEPYSWVSENDTSRTDYALLASSDSTKTFTYEKGQISYGVSLLGTTKTVRLEKTG